MLPKKTDPAYELAEFSKWINNIPNVNGAVPLYQAIANNTQVDPSHEMFYAMLSAISKRIVVLNRIRNEYVENNDIDASESQHIAEAGSYISMTLAPQNLTLAWSMQTRVKVRDKDIIALMSFSHKIRDSYPLRAIYAEDVADICKQIDEQYGIFFNDKNLETWISSLICSGLLDLKWTIQHLRFFGHELFFDKMFLVQQKASRIAALDIDSITSSKLFKVANVIAVLSTLYSAPDTNYQSTKHYFPRLFDDSSAQPLFPASKAPEDNKNLTLGKPQQGYEIKPTQRLLPSPRQDV